MRDEYGPVIGDKELFATGESALLLANWLGGAMASGLVPR
jgi:hypothetical protein